MMLPWSDYGESLTERPRLTTRVVPSLSHEVSACRCRSPRLPARLLGLVRLPMQGLTGRESSGE